MKRHILLFLLLCLSGLSHAQRYQWQGVPGIGGIDLSKCNVLALTEDTLHGLLIIHGDFDSAGGMYSPHFATYDGKQFLPNPYGDPTSKYTNIGMYNSQLVACDDYGVYMYDTLLQKWKTIGTIGGGYVNCIGNYKGELIVGGLFTSINGKAARSIARWDGATWRSLAPGILGDVYVVDDVQEYHGKLYVGGNFNNGGNVGAWNIVSWDGIKWSKAGCYGTGLTGHMYGGDVFALTVYKDRLYAGGRFDTICGKKTKLAYWNDTSWNVTGYNHKEIDQMVADTDSIYLVHGYAPVVYSWNGISSSAVDSGFNGQLRLCFFKGALYAGGTFDSSGQTPCYRLARLVRDTFFTADNKSISSAAIQIFPNPAGDEITIEGGNAYEALQVTDTWGRTVKYLTAPNPSHSIYVGNLHPGLYFITIKNGAEIITRRFVKE